MGTAQLYTTAALLGRVQVGQRSRRGSRKDVHCTCANVKMGSLAGKGRVDVPGGTCIAHVRLRALPAWP
eukprot:360529-Chlamydomonas_euryale.AAC.1